MSNFEPARELKDNPTGHKDAKTPRRTNRPLRHEDTKKKNGWGFPEGKPRLFFVSWCLNGRLVPWCFFLSDPPA